MLNNVIRKKFTFDKSTELWDFNSELNPINATTSGQPLDAVENGVSTSPYVTAIFGYEDYTGYVSGSDAWFGVIEVSDAPGGFWKEVGKVELIPGIGLQSEVSFSGQQLSYLVGSYAVLADKVYIRATMTKEGGAGDLTACCFLGNYS